MTSYKDVRTQINTDDIVIFRRKNNLFSLILQLLTISKWSHVGIAVMDRAKNIVYLGKSTLFEGQYVTYNIIKKGNT
jgi:hypothetical protein